MILPNLRASFGSDEIEILLHVLEERTRRSRKLWEGQLAEAGLDSLLDHPETFSAVMSGRRVTTISPKLTFYVMVRHTLRESGLDDPAIADYVAALLIEFTVEGRAQRIGRYDEVAYRYLADIVGDLEGESSERRQFLLHAHLGNYSLWLAGLFPDYVIARLHRRGAPGIDYYEDLGATGFLLASEYDLADHYDLVDVYRQVAGGFRAVRRALNRVSDRYFFPISPPPIDRLLRQAVDLSDSHQKGRKRGN
ncbi:MAG: hypothetical protein JSV86_05855 [Gemmatimonadota bacterium]|nr:MAG: hypothetical protein JSV86_05855 [Gemmatimonadota bacterium]